MNTCKRLSKRRDFNYLYNENLPRNIREASLPEGAPSRLSAPNLLPGDPRRLRLRRPALADATIPPLALLKLHQRLKQLRAVEIRPQRLSNQYFGVSNLPQQEIADAHLPAGPNQQVGIRQASGIQVPGELHFRNPPPCAGRQRGSLRY